YTITSSTTSGATGCVKRYLVTSGVFTGQALALNDCHYEPETFADIFVFYATSPCSFRVHTTAFTPWIFLYQHSTGFLINGTTSFEPGVDVVLGIPSCTYENGAIEAWVTSDDGESGGAYTLTVTLFPPPGGSVRTDTSSAGSRA